MGTNRRDRIHPIYPSHCNPWHSLYGDCIYPWQNDHLGLNKDQEGYQLNKRAIAFDKRLPFLFIKVINEK
jgi:hypothetical protein